MATTQFTAPMISADAAPSDGRGGPGHTAYGPGGSGCRCQRAPTAYLRAAQAAGATALDGTAMMVGQAAVNFTLWTGIEPDHDVMRAALEATLAS